MANYLYTNELKTTLRLFSSRTYFPFFSDFLQSNQSNYVIKPRMKIVDLYKKGREKPRLWPILSNIIWSKKTYEIAKIYLAYLAKEIKKRMRYISLKHSIPLKDIIKDYLYLCNQKIQIQQRNKILETYILTNNNNTDLKALLLSSMLPTISRNRKVTRRIVPMGVNTIDCFGRNGDDEPRAYYQTSMYFYDAKKEERKKQLFRTPLIRIMEIDYKMKKIMKNLLVERNKNIEKNSTNTNNVNASVRRKSELIVFSQMKLDNNNHYSINSRNSQRENKIPRVSSCIAPKREAMSIKLIKNAYKTVRKDTNHSKMRNRSAEIIINHPTLLIHHKDLYY